MQLGRPAPGPGVRDAERVLEIGDADVAEVLSSVFILRRSVPS